MSKYYIAIKPGIFSRIYEPIEAESVKIVKDLDLFIYKDKYEYYILSEAITGLKIIEVTSKEQCIKNFLKLDLDDVMNKLINSGFISPYNKLTEESEKNGFKIGMEIYTRNKTGHGEILGFTKDNKIYARMISLFDGMLDIYIDFDKISKHNVVNYNYTEEELDTMFNKLII
jgi:hypothetical protein